MSVDEGVRRLQELQDARLVMEEEGRKTQYALGRLSARERVERLFDEASFVELEGFAQDSHCLCGWGLVDGRPVYALAQDAGNGGGAMGQAQSRKMLKALEMARTAAAPVVLLPDSRGAQVNEGAPMLMAYAAVFAGLARLSGVCPLLSLLNGSAVGIAAHFAALSDLSVAVDAACEVMPFPPKVMQAAQGIDLTVKALGGAEALSKKGLAALRAPDEQSGIALLRRLLSLLPLSSMDAVPFEDGDDINRLNIAHGKLADIAADLCDRGSALELFGDWQQGSRTWLCRIGGHSLGMVATEPERDGGRLGGFACDKIARLVSFCDAFGLPVVTLLDTEGLQLPTPEGQAWLMTASARMLSSYAQADCVKLAVIMGKAVGAGYVSFAGSAIADRTLAWPSAYIAPLTAEAAVQAFDTAQMQTREREELVAERSQSSDAFAAAREGLVDDVIHPADTRKHLIAALELLDA